MTKGNSPPSSTRPAPTARRSPFFRHYTFSDFATQGYIAIVGLLILAFHNDRVSGWHAMLALHAAGLLAIHALIRVQARFPGVRWLDFLRQFYPILLFTGLYHETGLLNQLFSAGYADAAFLRLEQSLFGWQPGVELMERFPSRWISEILHGAYFCYYLMVGGVGLALLIKNRSQFAHFLSVVSFVFYVCYLIYIFTPVVGPRILYPGVVDFPLPPDVVPAQPLSIPPEAGSAWFAQIMRYIYENFEAPGAAFPSSHVAVALTTVFFSFRYLRPIRWAHLLVALLLCIGTVYGRYHYVVDVAAGVAAAAILAPLGNWLHRRFAPNGPRQPA